jgi:hypothetical protein
MALDMIGKYSEVAFMLNKFLDNVKSFALARALTTAIKLDIFRQL